MSQGLVSQAGSYFSRNETEGAVGDEKTAMGDWETSSTGDVTYMVEPVPSMYEAMGSIPSASQKQKEKKTKTL